MCVCVIYLYIQVILLIHILSYKFGSFTSFKLFHKILGVVLIQMLTYDLARQY